MQRYIMITALLWLTTASATTAQEAPIGMVTGPATGTYIEFGQNIAEVASMEGQEVDVKASNGSIDNIRRITEKDENAGLGIVQSDVLSFLKRSENPRSQALAKRLRMVFPFYAEEVHVLARKDINSLAELKDKRVAIGQQGSGNMLTAMNLFAVIDVKPEQLVQIPPDEGVVAVLSDEVDATIFTAGKPVTLFKNLEQVGNDKGGKYAHLLKQVHFIPVDDPRILEEYEAASITPQDYDFVEKEVPTVAVTSVLVAFDFSSGKNAYYAQRCNQLEAIGRAIRSNIDYLKANGHAKWKEVNPYRKVALWTRDTCGWRNARPQQAAVPTINNELERDLLSIIQQKKK